MDKKKHANSLKLLVLPGDGIGPEVINQALRVVDWFNDKKLDSRITVQTGLVAGASIDAHGVPVTDEVVEQARAADAILFGAGGGPKWDNLPVNQRAEAGLLRLRRDLNLYAALRPAVCHPETVEASALRRELVVGLDLLIVRELTSGVYFGVPRGSETLPDGQQRVYDTQAYTTDEIRRVCRIGFLMARKRRKKLCSVDKANVMATGQFWRAIVTEMAKDYPDVELTHMLADNCAMQLVRNPKQFDVIVTDNLFGDILSDESAALTGSLGLMPSASLGELDADGYSHGLYEPIHGSAPDIAGRGIANPFATILSFAMCLRLSFGVPDCADLLEASVRKVLRDGARTADIALPGQPPMSTSAVTDRLLAELDRTTR